MYIYLRQKSAKNWQIFEFVLSVSAFPQNFTTKEGV